MALNVKPEDKDIFLAITDKLLSVAVFAGVFLGLGAIMYNSHVDSGISIYMVAAAEIIVLFAIYQLVTYRIDLVSPENCRIYDKAIAAMIMINLCIGVAVAMYYHMGQSNTMFIPLVIGFVTVFIMYFLIEKRMEIQAGKPVDKY